MTSRTATPATGPGSPWSAHRSSSATGPVRIRSARRSGTEVKPGPSSEWSATSGSAGWSGPASRRCTCPPRRSPRQSPPNFDPKDLVIRHSGQGEALVSAVRQIVRAADPEQPISDVRTMDDVLAGDTATPARPAPGARCVGGRGRAALRRRHLRPAGLHGVAAIAGDRRASRPGRGPVARGPHDLRRRDAPGRCSASCRACWAPTRPPEA